MWTLLPFACWCFALCVCVCKCAENKWLEKHTEQIPFTPSVTLDIFDINSRVRVLCVLCISVTDTLPDTNRFWAASFLFNACAQCYCRYFPLLTPGGFSAVPLCPVLCRSAQTAMRLMFPRCHCASFTIIFFLIGWLSGSWMLFC